MTSTQRAHTSSVIERARRSDEEQGYTRINVAPSERAISAVGGAILAGYGLSRGTLGGLALALVGGSFLYRGVTGNCQLYSALGVDSAHEGHALFGRHKGVKVQEIYTVNKPPAECYAFWRKLENLPRFMTHLASVSETTATHSHWEAVSPVGGTVGWDAEIITDRPNELISWRSVGKADVDNAGSVSFRAAPGGRGTEITVELNYEAPGGFLGRWFAWAAGESPDIQVREDLRHFKQIMEAGEMPTVQGQSSGR